MITEAIVIKRTPAREHDLMITLYTRESGKLTALAKGAMKPGSVQALQLDPGNSIHCDLVAGRTGMPIMTGAQSLRCLSRAKANPASWAAVQFFLQIIDSAVFDQERDDSLWTCLTDVFGKLEENTGEGLLAEFRKGQLSLLTVLGYGAGEMQSVHGAQRTAIDDKFEQLADRKLKSLDLFYELAA